MNMSFLYSINIEKYTNFEFYVNLWYNRSSIKAGGTRKMKLNENVTVGKVVEDLKRLLSKVGL